MDTKMLSIYKNLQLGTIVAALALSISSQALAAQAAQIFTIDPNAAFGLLGGPHSGVIAADKINGPSSTLVSLHTPTTDALQAEGWIVFTGFSNNGHPVWGSGLNNDWQMWAEFTYSAVLTSGTYGAAGSTYSLNALHADFWVDPTLSGSDNSFTSSTFIGSNHLGQAATVIHGDNSYKIATADLIPGQGETYINEFGGTGFNVITTFTLFSPSGSGLFTGPAIPTYIFQEFENNGQGVYHGANFLAINLVSGAISGTISPVPEPETSTMLLAGLGLMGFVANRRSRGSARF